MNGFRSRLSRLPPGAQPVNIQLQFEHDKTEINAPDHIGVLFSALDQVRRRRPCRFLSTGRRLTARRLHGVDPPPSLSATGKTARRQANPPPTADRNSIEFFDEIHRPLARSVTRRAPGPSKDDRPS